MGCTQKKPRTLGSQTVGLFQKKAKRLIQQEKLKDAQKIADILFQDCQWQEAAALYKRIIQQHLDFDYQIDGLGCIDEQVGYYVKNVESWYRHQKINQNIKGTPYDALSLCLSKTDRYDWESFSNRRKWYQQTIQKYPDNYQLHFGLGNLLNNQAIYEEAIAAYNNTIELKPGFIKPYIDIAFIYQFGLGQKHEVVDWANKALEIDYNDPFALYLIIKNQQQSQAKIERLKQLADKFPKYVRIANELGTIYRSNHQESIKWFKRCIQHYPQYETAYNNIGLVYDGMNDYEQAMGWFFKACEIDYDYEECHANLVNIFIRLNLSYEDILSRSRSYNLKRDAFCYYVGLAYYNKKMLDLSLEWFQLALEVNKYNYNALNGLGMAYDSKQFYEQALENYMKCIKIKPDFFRAYFNIGVSFSNQKNTQQAIKWYTKAISVHPRYYQVYSNLAKISQDKNQHQQAIKWLSKALELNSTYSLGWINIGLCHLKMQNYKVAYHCFDRAYQILPLNTDQSKQIRREFSGQKSYKFNDGGDGWKGANLMNAKMKYVIRQLMSQIDNKLKGNTGSDQMIARSAEVIIDMVRER